MTIDDKFWILASTGKLNGLWVALISCLAPAGYIALIWTSTRTATPAGLTQLLIDPGPRHMCYSFKDLARNTTLASNRSTSECALMPQYAGCPTWHFSSFDAGENHEDLMRGGNGSLVNITVVNNAQGSGRPIETSFEYLYPGCGIEKSSNSTQYNLLDFADWIFDYDITIRDKEIDKPTLRHRMTSWNETRSQNSSTQAGPPYQSRSQIISTDFVYQWPDPKCSDFDICAVYNSTISVVHYQPFRDVAEGPYWQNSSFNLRLIHDQELEPNKTSHVSLNFGALFKKYRYLLCHGDEDPPWMHVHTIRIVNTNIETNSTIDIQNVQASLSKSSGSESAPWQPMYSSYDGIPNYCPGAPSSSAVRPSNASVGVRFAG